MTDTAATIAIATEVRTRLHTDRRFARIAMGAGTVVLACAATSAAFAADSGAALATVVSTGAAFIAGTVIANAAEELRRVREQLIAVEWGLDRLRG